MIGMEKATKVIDKPATETKEVPKASKMGQIKSMKDAEMYQANELA